MGPRAGNRMQLPHETGTPAGTRERLGRLETRNMRKTTFAALLVVLLSTLLWICFAYRPSASSAPTPTSATKSMPTPSIESAPGAISQSEPPAPGATLASFGTTYDIDHLPMFIDIYDGQTLSFVRYGNSKTNARFTVYEDDGKGMLLLQMPGGGPIGTVASFRTLRQGHGQILVHFTGSGPGGKSGTRFIRVIVH